MNREGHLSLDSRMHELITLKTIAETLNQSHHLGQMLQNVLEQLLDLTELSTGWIFIVDGTDEYNCAADRNLPPALAAEDKQPMRCGSCWCLEKYEKGTLHNAVNMISCARLEEAVANQSGDTLGITHHATVPLRSGERQYGLMNIAAPGKDHFSDAELALLQSVALQIGSAIERIRLYETEQRRSQLLTAVSEFSSALGRPADGSIPLKERITSLIGDYFNWPLAVLYEYMDYQWAIQSMYKNPSANDLDIPVTSVLHPLLERASAHFRCEAAQPTELNALTGENDGGSSIPISAFAVAIPAGDSKRSVLVIASDSKNHSDSLQTEVMETVADHIGAALERLALDEERRQIARWEERNQIARDLHDSVCQMLFSLSLTAKGVETMLTVKETPPVISAIRDIRTLSQEALREMRELITQMRPSGLEHGLLTALQVYGGKLGLRTFIHLNGVRNLPAPIEETLWRIGQEALNNVLKHSGTTEATITLDTRPNTATLQISDNGVGGIETEIEHSTSNEQFGLTNMKQRAEDMGGSCTITSTFKKGTVIKVTLPLPSVKDAQEDT